MLILVFLIPRPCEPHAFAPRARGSLKAGRSSPPQIFPSVLSVNPRFHTPPLCRVSVQESASLRAVLYVPNAGLPSLVQQALPAIRGRHSFHGCDSASDAYSHRGSHRYRFMAPGLTPEHRISSDILRDMTSEWNRLRQLECGFANPVRSMIVPASGTVGRGTTSIA